MNSPNPVPTPGALPSNSTTATAIGGAIATIVIWGLSLKGITLPPGVECAAGVLFSTICGYFPQSGRK